MPYWDPDGKDTWLANNTSNLGNASVWSLLMGLFFLSPLINVQQYDSNLNARNRDLNPIGSKNNVRQNFGADSNKIRLTGFISPLIIRNPGISAPEFESDLLSNILGFAGNADSSKLLNMFKITFLKNTILYQKKFFVVTNNDFDIVTIDNMSYKESENDPHVYRVQLECTSVRNYQAENFLSQLASDTIINGFATTFANLVF